MAGPVRLVAMDAGDIGQVLAIEEEAQGNPWSEKIFREELEREWARLVVLKEGDEVLAYCNYWLVHDEVHLLNIATAARARRRGLGHQLMAHIIAFAEEHRCRYVTLEVRQSNAAAIAMYERCGFRSVGIRRAYYSDNREDARVMLLELDPGGSEGAL